MCGESASGSNVEMGGSGGFVADPKPATMACFFKARFDRRRAPVTRPGIANPTRMLETTEEWGRSPIKAKKRIIPASSPY